MKMENVKDVMLKPAVSVRLEAQISAFNVLIKRERKLSMENAHVL